MIARVRRGGVFASVVAAALGGELAWGAAAHVGSKKVPGWDPDQFMWLAAAALVAVLASATAAVFQLRSEDSPTLTYLIEVVGSLVVSLAAAFTISNAVAAERQNYWDAVHFASLFWVGVLTAVASTVVATLASKRGDSPVQALSWIPALVVALWVLLWMVTWFTPLGDFLGWAAGWLYLATHG
jgi:hypothetical protein